MTKWCIYVSLDNRTWIPADSLREGFPGDTIFNFIRPFNTRFVKIIGEATECTPEFDPQAFAFYYIKLFGSLKPLNICANTCKCKRINNNNIIKIIFLVINEK